MSCSQRHTSTSVSVHLQSGTATSGSPCARRRRRSPTRTGSAPASCGRPACPAARPGAPSPTGAAPAWAAYSGPPGAAAAERPAPARRSPSGAPTPSTRVPGSAPAVGTPDVPPQRRPRVVGLRRPGPGLDGCARRPLPEPRSLTTSQRPPRSRATQPSSGRSALRAATTASASSRVMARPYRRAGPRARSAKAVTGGLRTRRRRRPRGSASRGRTMSTSQGAVGDDVGHAADDSSRGLPPLRASSASPYASRTAAAIRAGRSSQVLTAWVRTGQRRRSSTRRFWPRPSPVDGTTCTR